VSGLVEIPNIYMISLTLTITARLGIIGTAFSAKRFKDGLTVQMFLFLSVRSL